MTEQVELQIAAVESKPGSFFNGYWRVPMDLITTELGTFIADPANDDFRGSEGQVLTLYHYKSTGTEYYWLSRTPEQKV